MENMKHRPNTLTNAPLQYAPTNELGVVYLFAHIAKKLQFQIEEIRPKFPDCIAYRKAGNSERLVRIEFEFKSTNFRTHKHNPKDCDCIACWHHDWPDAPQHLEIIELRRHFDAAPKIWIQPVIKNQWHWLDNSRINWGLSKRSTPGDLLLMYRCYPEKSIKDIFIFTGELNRAKADWREGDCYGGEIKRICTLDSPIYLEDFRHHAILKTASFVRKNMQGNLLVSEYWPYLYQMIISRNVRLKKLLSKFAPEKL